MDALMKSDILSALWVDIQAFLASDPKPNDGKTLSHGNIRHSMSMPRYFFDEPICFDEATLKKIGETADRHELRLDVREESDGKERGNFVIFDREGNYLGRITTKGLTLTPQRFGEALFREIMSLYLSR
jgi:hypothetical protein